VTLLTQCSTFPFLFYFSLYQPRIWQSRTRNPGRPSGGSNTPSPISNKGTARTRHTYSSSRHSASFVDVSHFRFPATTRHHTTHATPITANPNSPYHRHSSHNTHLHLSANPIQPDLAYCSRNLTPPAIRPATTGNFATTVTCQ
jgi:hypothetical protein